MRLRTSVMILIGVLAIAGCDQGPSTAELISDLSSTDEGDRLKAVRHLQNRNSDAAEVVPALTESLKSKDADIRLSAAIGLGYFGAEAKSALPALDETQRDSDARVRNAARVAISRIR